MDNEEAKDYLKGFATSRTVHGNAWFIPLILMAIKGWGIELTPELTGAVYAVCNLGFRIITEKSLKDK